MGDILYEETDYPRDQLHMLFQAQYPGIDFYFWKVEILQTMDSKPD